MININRIQLQIKIKNIKKQLINNWYKLMKPLANLIDKIEKKRSDKFYKKARSMTIEEVVKRFSRLIIKDLIRYSNNKRKYVLEFEIAYRTKYDEDGNTPIEYMQNQFKDKKLKHWAYSVKDKLNINKELADLLIHKYLRQSEITIKTFKNECYDEYTWKKPEDYQYTVQISL